MLNGLKVPSVFLLFCLISDSLFGAPSNHLQNLKARFPYGLWGDDYGILTMNDLALNACRIEPKPFVPNELNPYEYWQCFENKNISLLCEDNGYWEDVGGASARVIVQAYANQVLHEFIESRPWSQWECKSFLRDLKRIMKGTSHSCISGYQIATEISEKGKQEFIGLLDRFKTSKGCEGRECELTEKIKKEFCPDLNL